MTLNKQICFLILLCFCQTCFAQTVTRQYIDSSLKLTDSSFGLKRPVSYLINGVHYDSLQMDQALTRYQLIDLVDLFYLTCEKTQLAHCENDIAIIAFTYEQKQNIKQNTWKKARKLFSQSDTPILYLNKKQIEPTETRNVFSALQLREIKYIDTSAGKIRIWTRQQ